MAHIQFCVCSGTYLMKIPIVLSVIDLSPIRKMSSDEEIWKAYYDDGNLPESVRTRCLFPLLKKKYPKF